MANDIPSLGEINSFRPDAELGGGSPAVLNDSRETVRILNESANQKAQNDWNKYLLFQNNLKDVYKNISDVEGLETAPQDKKYLSDKMGEVFQDISKDPRAFFGGGKTYFDIQSRLAKLKGEATQSQQDYLYDDAHRKYLMTNPELNTDENKNLIQGYLNAPLGQRKAYTLNMPTLFDYQTYMSDALKSSASKESYASDIQGNKDGIGYITSATKYDRGRFMNIWNTGLKYQTDKNGHPIASYAQQQFDRLPKEQQKQYGSAENYWDIMGQNAFGSKGDIITDKEIKFDEGQYKAAEINLDKIKVQIEAGKAKASETADYASAGKSKAETEKVNAEVSKMLSNPSLNNTFDKLIALAKPSKYGSNIESKNVSNLDLAMLGGFDIEKTIDGSVNTIKPKAGFFTNHNIKALTVRKDDNGNTYIAYPETDADGKPTGDYKRVYKEDVLNNMNLLTTQLGTKGETIFGNTGQPKTTTKKTYQYAGKTLTEDQLQKGADKYTGGDIEKYKNQLGIK